MFSVIIPLYNKEKSILNTINSVLKQSYIYFELIIVDDGSSDNSLNVVYSISDDRIKVFTQENKGVSNARNKGIKESKYEWITFIDADDLWMENHLETLFFLIMENSTIKVFSTSFMKNNEVEINSDDRYYIIKDYFSDAMHKPIIWTGVVLINKECFNNVGLFNEVYKRGEDLDMWARLSKVYTIVKSLKITAIYRIDAENRCCKNKMPIELSILSGIDFKRIRSSEKKYYIKLIRSKIWSSIRSKDYKFVVQLLKKYNYRII